MTSEQTGVPDYDARIRRAQYLAANHSFAAEVMNFYTQVASFQRRLYASFPPSAPQKPGVAPTTTEEFRSRLDLALLLQHFPDLLAVLQRVGTQPVADAARQLALQGPAAWITFLTEYWTNSGRAPSSFAARPEETEPHPPVNDALVELILRAFLEPYAEFLAHHSTAPAFAHTPSVCSLCGSGPLLGVLRPEGDGAKRFLVCSFCLDEWEFRRILCPTCGEESESKLPVYIAEQFPHIRVEACDTCKFCLRTVDLTKDGHAVPVVDDLAALPLTLWAQEHGYARARANLLST
jgi:formate dehydrogenase maturation protein FdhE